MKPIFGSLVLVTWVDIQGDSAWTSEEQLTPAVCTSVGFFNCFKKDKEHGSYLLLFASYNKDDRGDRIAIPKSVIKDIKVLRGPGKLSKKIT